MDRGRGALITRRGNAGQADRRGSQLLVTRPAHVGSSWTLEVDAGAAGDRIGLLVRAGDVALRPKRDFLGFPTSGLVFLDDSLAEIAVPFVVSGSGKVTLTIPPAGDQAGDAYALQAVRRCCCSATASCGRRTRCRCGSCPRDMGAERESRVGD